MESEMKPKKSNSNNNNHQCGSNLLKGKRIN